MLERFFPRVTEPPNQPSESHRASKHIELYAAGGEATEGADAAHSLQLHTRADSRKHPGRAEPESGPSSKLGNLTWQQDDVCR
jgi:hypothetical protein